MKLIPDFTTALHYVNRLGFAGSGSIAHRQASLCDMTDKLVAAAGGYPYRARFTTYKDQSTGFCYPYLGEFNLVTADGRKVRVKP